jgi:hypothetical protein
VKVITSLGAELNRAYKMKEEDESRLEQFKEEAHKQKEKVREWNTEVGKLKCHVKRFNMDNCHAMGSETYSCIFGFDGQLSHAIEKAVKTKDASSNVLKVKNRLCYQTWIPINYPNVLCVALRVISDQGTEQSAPSLVMALQPRCELPLPASFLQAMLV